MAAFIRISDSLVNVETITRIDDVTNPTGCTVVAGSAKYRVKETADQVVQKVRDAEAGKLPTPNLSPPDHLTV